MEQRIENYIENSLENVASQLFLFSIIFGAFLIILGIFLMIRHSTKRYLNTLGMTCIVIGIIAIFSSIIQI